MNGIETLKANSFVQQGKGTYKVGIASNGTNSALQVTTGASLAGTLSVTANPGTYLAGSTWTVLSTASDVASMAVTGVNGTFDNYAFPAGFQFKVNYSPNFVQLQLLNTPVGPGIAIGAGNASRVRDYISSLPITAGTDLFTVLQSLNSLTTADALSDALHKLQPSPLACIDWSNAWNLSRVNEETIVRSDDLLNCFCECDCHPCGQG